MQKALEAVWVVDAGVQTDEVHRVGRGAVIPANNQKKFFSQSCKIVE